VIDSPSLRNNKFALLSVEETNECQFSPTSYIVQYANKVESNPHPPLKPFYRRPRWEKRLPDRYIIASTPSHNSINLQVQVQTVDTGALHAVTALVDSGATGQFIDAGFVHRHQLSTRPLSRPIPVYNVDGTPNEAGSIREVVDLVLRYKDHTERGQFAVTGLGKQSMILGITWLRQHNPEVDWRSGEIKMTRCPRECRTCAVEEKEERKIRKVEALSIRACRTGPMPSIEVEDCELLDIGEDEDDIEEDGEIVFEDENRLFATSIWPDEQSIRATGTVSQ
jgi:Retroviral aspartyl protease